jgi:hypothetical protein
MKPVAWRKICWDAFPPEGLFGEPPDWFRSNEAAFVATWDREDLILIQHIWCGFPDPPEWGLWSRAQDRHDLPWLAWGHVPELPPAWIVPRDDG